MKNLLVLAMVAVIAANANAQTEVSGVVSGTWTAAGSPYVVTADILVAGLTVEPGVQVEFAGNFVFEVGGVITAVGTEAAPIVFKRADANTTGWQGFFFNFSTVGSLLKFCRIEGAINSGIRVIGKFSTTMEHCTLLNNSGTMGGGLHVSITPAGAGELLLKDCLFSNNSSSSHGGAMYVNTPNGSRVSIIDSAFESNTANPLVATGNFVGGAIYITDGDVSIDNSLFDSNRVNSRCEHYISNCSVLSRGGATYTDSTGTLNISNSSFVYNQSYSQNNGGCYADSSSTKSHGAGLYVQSGAAVLINNLFSLNSTTGTNCWYSDAGASIYVNGGSVTVINNAIAHNDTATGVHCAGGTLDIMNSIIFFNNGGGDQIGGTCTVTYSDVQNGYTGEGNINVNPIFDSDMTLKIVNDSQCIDAGNPAEEYNDQCFPPSLGTERNDMGAHGGLYACGWYGNVSTTSLRISEPDESAEFTVSLARVPTHDVIVTLTSSNPLECEVFPPYVVLNSENWNSGVVATVTAVDDDLVDGDQSCRIITANAVSDDPDFNGMVIPDVSVIVEDDEIMLTITSVYPAYGQEGMALPVTIQGSGFSGTPNVYLSPDAGGGNVTLAKIQIV